MTSRAAAPDVHTIDPLAPQARMAGTAQAIETPIGYVPTEDALGADDLPIDGSALQELLQVDHEEWKAEIPSINEHFNTFGDRLPKELLDELEALKQRLG